MVARTQTVARWWFAILALIVGLLVPGSAPAAPVLFSTSGDFAFPSATTTLTGVTNAKPQDRLLIGAIPIPPADGMHHLGDTPFHLHFQFTNGLSPIDVSGIVRSIGYNTDWPIRNPVVTTSAASADLGLYPAVFQSMLAHPDWLHSTSFAGAAPTMELVMTVHPEDPFEIRPVPEPSSVVVFAMALAGLGWRARRRTAR